MMSDIWIDQVFWITIIDLYKSHLCLWGMKHYTSSQEHVAEQLQVIVTVVVGLRLTASTQHSMRPPHSVHAPSSQ